MSELRKTTVPEVRLVMRQPAQKHEQEEARQPAALRQRDPLAQGGGRPGGATAEVHASILSRATDTRHASAQESLLRLQRTYGNRYVSRVVDLSRKGHGEGDVTPEVEADIQRERGGGQALDSAARAQMEPAMGADFSGVRVHTGGQADTLNRNLSARAFTTGQDIFFKQGEYSPGSSRGRELLAHELTHVVQQGGDRVKRKLTVGAVDDPYEQEADRTAGQVMRSISEATQRQSVSEEEEKKEEPLQAKLDGGPAQRQVEEEEKKEEEPVQMQPQKGSIHRQAEEEKKEEQVQAKLDGPVQRQAEEEEEEEPLQATPDAGGVQRQVGTTPAVIQRACGATIDVGKQDKHIEGKPNFMPGKSKLTHLKPQELIDQFHGTGQVLSNPAISLGEAGYRERVNFGQVIGEYFEQGKPDGVPTTNGVLHYAAGKAGKGGAAGAANPAAAPPPKVHIVPARP